MSFVLFSLLLMHFKWKRFPVLPLLSATCFIKEPIKNLKPFEIKERKTACKPSSDCLPAPWFLPWKTPPIVSHYHSSGNSKYCCKLTDIKNSINNTLKQ